MTPEAQRIAIAEACGWTAQEIEAAQAVRTLRSEYRKLPKRESFSGWAIADKIERAEDSKHYRGQIPDYLADLNAMHEAEKALTQEQRDACYGVAWKLARERVKMHETPCIEAGWAVYHANAAERTEAFLRTLGKWEDSK